MILTIIIICSLLSLFFLVASAVKMLSWQKIIFEQQIEFFKKYELNRIHMFVIGVIEFTAVAFLIAFLITKSPLYCVVGAGLIALTSLGALLFHLRFDKFNDAIPSIITLMFSTFLLIFNKQLLLQYLSFLPKEFV